jgi:pilus assembly protein CpaF
VDLIVQISRFSDGTRRISSITEIRGLTSKGDYEVVDIFRMSRLVRKPDGKLEGALQPTGEVPSFMQEIVDNNLPFSQAKFTKVS